MMHLFTLICITILGPIFIRCPWLLPILFITLPFPWQGQWEQQKNNSSLCVFYSKFNNLSYVSISLMNGRCKFSTDRHLRLWSKNSSLELYGLSHLFRKRAKSKWKYAEWLLYNGPGVFFNSFGRITQEDCRFTAWFSAISGIFGRIAMLRKTAFLKGHPALVLRLYSALQISLYIFPLSPTMLDFIWPLLAAHWKKPFCVEKFCKNAKQSS